MAFTGRPSLVVASSVALATAVAATVAGIAVADSAAASRAVPQDAAASRWVAGSAAVRDRSGNLWLPDRAVVSGVVATRTRASIGGAANPALYRTEHYGSLAYSLPVPAGTWRLRLLFAEQRDTGPGERVVTLAANGAVVARRVDIGRGGLGRAHALTARVITGTAGLRLRLRAVRGMPAIAAIELVGLAPTPTQTPTQPPSTTQPPSQAPTQVPTHMPAPTQTQTRTPTQSPTPSPTQSPTQAPTRAQTPTPTQPPSVPSVTPEDYGAVGDGTTDDTAALQAAFDNADGRTVVLAAGHVYAHTGVLLLRTAGLRVTGGGTLLATNEATSSVWIDADDVTIDGGLTIATARTTRRWDAWEQMGLRLDGHSGAVVRDVTVTGSAAAGIYVGGADHFVLDHVTVSGTRADGIHITEGSYDGTVLDPTVIKSGDDGVAVVSYAQDGAPCHDITVTGPVVEGTTWGRGLSVVGGRNITETGIDVRDTDAAGVYIGSEGSPWFTTAARDVTVRGGTILRANTDATVDHGAVVVLSGEDDVSPADITVADLAITATRASASRDLGVITYGRAPTRVLFENITITGGPSSAYSGNTDQSAYTLRHIVQNGTALPNAG